MEKLIPILAGKSETVKPKLIGVGGVTSTITTGGCHQTMNQAYTYIMVIDDEDTERNEARLHRSTHRGG